MKLQDGTGSGSYVKVTTDNRIDTSSRQSTRAYYVSRDAGQSYIWTSSFSAATGNEIIYVKNDSTSKNLYIDFIHVSGVNTGLFEVYQVSGTAAGTTITGRNLNLTSSNVADATSYGDASVTGLTIGNRLYLHRTPANSSGTMEINDTLILGVSDAIALTYTGSTGIVDAEIRGFFE